MKNRIFHVLLLSGLTACAMPADREKSRSGADDATSSSKESGPTPSPEPSPKVASEQDFKLGIPPFCSAEQKSEQLCMTCTPRSLPLELCRSVRIDPATECSWKPTKIECGEQLSFDLTERQAEKVYEALPLYVMVARGFVNSKLKDDQQSAAGVQAGLTFLEDNALDLFTGQNTELVKQRLTAAVKTGWPQATEEQLNAVEKAASPALSDLAVQVKAEKIDQKAMMDIALRFAEALPLSEKARSRIDFAAVKESFAKAADERALVEILMAQLGISSLDELVAMLQPKPTQLRLLGTTTNQAGHR